jgi:hypothetical protein
METKEVRGTIQDLTKRAERLNTVDIAREIVVKLGGPPSRQTLQESLLRSAQERSAEKNLEPTQRRSELEEISQRVLGAETSQGGGRRAEEIQTVEASAGPPSSRSWNQETAKAAYQEGYAGMRDRLDNRWENESG